MEYSRMKALTKTFSPESQPIQSLFLSQIDDQKIYQQWINQIKNISSTFSNNKFFNEEILGVFFRALLDSFQGSNSKDHLLILDLMMSDTEADHITPKAILHTIRQLRQLLIAEILNNNYPQSESIINKIIFQFDHISTFLYKKEQILRELDLPFQSDFAIEDWDISLGTFTIPGPRFSSYAKVNTTLQKWFNQTESQIVLSQQWSQFIPENDLRKITATLDKAYAQRRTSYRIRYQFKIRNKQLRLVEENGEIRYNSNGIPRIIRGIIRPLEANTSAQSPGTSEEENNFVNRLAELIKINKEISLNIDHPDICQIILDKALELIPKADAGSFLRVEADGMHYAAAKGYNLEKLKKVVLFKGGYNQYSGISSQISMLENSSYIHQIKDLRKEARQILPPSEYEILVKYGELNRIQYTLSGLIYQDNKPFGIINIDIHQPGQEFTDNDQKLFDIFIQELSILLQNRQLIQQIQESEKNYRTLFENSPVAIFIEQNEQIILANPKFCELTGFKLTELRKHSIFNFLPEKQKKSLTKTLQRKSGKEYKFSKAEITIKGRDLQDRYCIGFFSRIHFKGNSALLGELLDITHIKSLENQLLQIQKMETVGTLTAGIAHDFNNILGAISPSAQLIMMNPHDPNTKQRAEVIFRMAERATKLTKQLLSFSRLDHQKVVPFNLNQVIQNSIPLIEKSLMKNIKLELSLDPNLKPIEGDCNRFAQIIMNLVVNARDAMPNGGKLRIVTRNIKVDESYKHLDRDFKAGWYVQLSVQDTGKGIPPEIRNKIFDPFFTTKEVGKGTGLGLSTVYGITKSHRGVILVNSEVNKGTTFELFFPASKKSVQAVAPIKNSENPQKGSGTILVIDDEEELREVYQYILKHLGYKAYVAASGKEGIKIYKSKHQEIDLVLLDYIMPEMNGNETFRELKKINPKIRAIVCSGYSEQKGLQELLQKGIEGILTKPFTLQTISKKIKEVLN